MKTDDLVNPYVLQNLLYELMFLEDDGVNLKDNETSDPLFLDRLIKEFVTPRFDSFKPETRTVIRNTICYLLANTPASDELWDWIWHICAAPFNPRLGVRHFFSRCREILFSQDELPSEEELAKFRVNNEMSIAIRLN